MASEVKAPSERRNGKARTFSDTLYRLTGVLRLSSSSRGLRVGVFDPLLPSNVVFPNRVVRGVGLRAVGELATVEPQRIVRCPKLTERNSRWTRGLRETSQSGRGDLPGFGKIEGEEVVVCVMLALNAQD